MDPRPGQPRTVRCLLGPTSATLTTDHVVVLEHLRHFYTLVDSDSRAGGWTFEATVGPPPRSMVVNRWGVGYAVEPADRRLRLRGADPYALAVTARTTVREALVDYCERRRYVMLHAAAVADARRVVVFVGERGGGKTTLGLRAVSEYGMRYLSNDHLILYADPAQAGPTADRLWMTALPAPIAVRVGTYLDLADRLPPPMDTEGVDLDAVRVLPRRQRYRLTDRVVYTFPGLGQESPGVVTLGAPGHGPEVRVVLVGYGDGDTPRPVPDPVAALLPHVRTDWVFDPRRNQRYLPRSERRPPAHARDARRLLAALAERATVEEWAHRGDPAPLLGRARPRGPSPPAPTRPGPPE